MLTDGDRRFSEPLGRWQRVLVTLRLRRSLEPSRRLRTPVSWIVDSVDERRALRLRTNFGQRRWLVSWQRQPEAQGTRGWRARLSCPALVFTLERMGKTRTEAIEAPLVRWSNSWPSANCCTATRSGSPRTSSPPTIRSVRGCEVVRFLAFVPTLFIVWSRTRNRDGSRLIRAGRNVTLHLDRTTRLLWSRYGKNGNRF